MPAHLKWASKADMDRDYYLRNKPRIQEYKRGRHQRVKKQVRLAKYGLTVGQYEEMRAEQAYACKLCGTAEEDCRDGVLAIDHDHKDGRVRGLLCNHCNLGIGHLQDDPELLMRAASYLKDRVI